MNQPNAILMETLIPAAELKITETGSTKETGWKEAINVTFTFDFTGATLAQVMEQAVQHMKVSARPSLKKAGFDALRINPTCDVTVKDIGNRKRGGGITTAGMVASLAAKAAAGTLTRADVEHVSAAARKSLIAILSAKD